MKCNFYLWPGAGYWLNGPYTVSDELLASDNLEYAIELLAAYLTKNGLKQFFLEVDEYEKMRNELRCEVEESGDWDAWDEVDDIEGYLYVDGTREGADRPIYLNVANLTYTFTE